MVLDFINFYIVPGLVTGSIYALGAVGITLIFSILRFAHLAHGDLITLGAFLVLAFVQALGVSVWWALPPAVVMMMAVVLLIDKLSYQAFVQRAPVITVMASLGIALMVRSVVQMVWGVDTERYTTGIVRPERMLGLLLKPHEIATFITVILTMAALLAFMYRTRWGRAMRAMSDNRDLASLCGVNNQHMRRITWAWVALLCVLAGMLLGLNTEIKSMMGWHLLLPMFAAAILGGVGRIEGAVVGGFLIGMAEEISVIWLPSQYKTVIAFVALLVMLRVRPTGLFKGKVL